ncbi:hypothetical protein [Humidisolicoccus flavus]|uniref:hypothetical protein n=1 Tax=Humidisolicoccus flavus TaxID=3111414 RepID=UPI00324C07CF
MTDAKRRTLRKVLMLSLIPFVLVGLFFAGKFLSVNVLVNNEMSAYERRSWVEAETHARGLEFFNFFETWKAPFNIAAPLAMRGDLPEARELLEHALTLVPEEEINNVCVVRTNLVYVIEKQGDEARKSDDREGANAFYLEALDVIDLSPEGCFQPPTAHEADTKAQLEASVSRIEEKIQQDSSESEGEGEGESGEQEESEQPQTPEEQLQEQNQQGQTEQQQQTEFEQGEGEGEGGPSVEQPW